MPKLSPTTLPKIQLVLIRHFLPKGAVERRSLGPSWSFVFTAKHCYANRTRRHCVAFGWRLVPAPPPCYSHENFRRLFIVISLGIRSTSTTIRIASAFTNKPTFLSSSHPVYSIYVCIYLYTVGHINIRILFEIELRAITM